MNIADRMNKLRERLWLVESEREAAGWYPRARRGAYGLTVRILYILTCIVTLTFYNFGQLMTFPSSASGVLVSPFWPSRINNSIVINLYKLNYLK